MLNPTHFCHKHSIEFSKYELSFISSRHALQNWMQRMFWASNYIGSSLLLTFSENLSLCRLGFDFVTMRPTVDVITNYTLFQLKRLVSKSSVRNFWSQIWVFLCLICPKFRLRTILVTPIVWGCFLCPKEKKVESCSFVSDIQFRWRREN